MIIFYTSKNISATLRRFVKTIVTIVTKLPTHPIVEITIGI